MRMRDMMSEHNADIVADIVEQPKIKINVSPKKAIDYDIEANPGQGTEQTPIKKSKRKNA